MESQDVLLIKQHLSLYLTFERLLQLLCRKDHKKISQSYRGRTSTYSAPQIGRRSTFDTESCQNSQAVLANQIEQRRGIRWDHQRHELAVFL